MPPYSANTGWPALALGTSYWIAAGCLIVWLTSRRTEDHAIAVVRVFLRCQFYLVHLREVPSALVHSHESPYSHSWYSRDYVSQIVGLAELKAGANGFTARDAFCSTCGRRSESQALALLRSADDYRAGGAPAETPADDHRARAAAGDRSLASLPGQRPTDTVFLEPLGYIGFYSNLKMLDYPGLSSPEVVAARRRASARDYPGCWPELIIDLSPTWLVLRSYEAKAINEHTPELLQYAFIH